MSRTTFAETLTPGILQAPLGNQIISLWVALDVVGRDNGGAEYVRGSHLTDKLYRPEEFGEDTRFKDMKLDRTPDIVKTSTS
jgi:ectoine hydroxylase-related dioxygenase (phytanoyl-CoA dioxygenase family)